MPTIRPLCWSDPALTTASHIRVPLRLRGRAQFVEWNIAPIRVRVKEDSTRPLPFSRQARPAFASKIFGENGKAAQSR